MNKRTCFIVILALIFCLRAGAAEATGEKPIDVLLISANESGGQISLAGLGQWGWLPFKAACAAQGVNVHILGEGNSAYKELTPELFRKFQVIALGGAPHTYNVDQGKIDEGNAFLRRVDDYHKAGGGLIFVPFGHDADPVFWTESFGKL